MHGCHECSSALLYRYRFSFYSFFSFRSSALLWLFLNFFIIFCLIYVIKKYFIDSLGKWLEEYSKIYQKFHSICQLHAFILNSMQGGRRNINNFYGLLAIIILYTFSAIWTYVTRALYIEDNKLVLLREGLATCMLGSFDTESGVLG